jgi:hypothetical protein
MNMQPVTSGQISEIGHDAAKNILAVRFRHGNTLYHYAGVDAEKFDQLRTAESVGAFLGKEIKSKHSFTKIVEKKEEDK